MGERARERVSVCVSKHIFLPPLCMSVGVHVYYACVLCPCAVGNAVRERGGREGEREGGREGGRDRERERERERGRKGGREQSHTICSPL